MKTITRFCANKLTIVSTLFVALLSISLFNSASSHALTVTTSPAAGTLSFNLTPGTFNKVSQTITVDNTNYHSGYTMTLETAGYEYLNPNTPGSQAPQLIFVHTNDLVNTTSPTDTTKRIPTLSSTITSPDNFHNNWGYSFFNTNIAVDDPLRNTFYPVPGYTTGTNPTPIQDTLTTTTTTSPTPDTYELSFGAKVDTSVPAGTYQNDIVVRVVSNPTTCSGGNICYDDNNANSPTQMGNQSIASTATEATLWASNYQRPGYGFAGWNTAPDGKGTSYGPNQTITDATTLNNIKNNGLILYAMWVKSAGDLQSWTPASCNAMNIGDTTALTDNRDGSTYAIAKLADGKCWMIENLRLSNTHTTTGQAVTINSSNTNNPASGFTLNAPQDPTSSSWCTTNNAACIDQSRHATNNTQNPVSTMTNPDSNVYSYGNYYNWYTATAGNGTYSMLSGNTAGDICPAGWHLPTGGNSGEYRDLNNALGGNTGAIASNTLRSFPNHFIYSGSLSGSSLSSRGSYGFYRSSTANSNNVYSLIFNSGQIGSSNDSISKNSGNVVRCVLSTTYTINFNSNGGSGNMNPQTATIDTATNLTPNTFTRTGFTFAGWNTEANGSGTSYTDGQSVTNLASVGGSITLYAQWYSGSITYNDNGANSTTAMSNQTINSSDTEVTLWPSNFQHNGGDYGFAGWSTEPIDSTLDINSINQSITNLKSQGKIYGPMETITDQTTINEIKNNGLTLYAIWIPSRGDMTVDILMYCANESNGFITALTDERDNNTYAVIVRNGICQMMENLRLGGNNPIALNHLNTDIPSGTTGTLPASTDRFTSSSYNSIEMNAVNTLNPVSTMTKPDANIYSYGNYYSWAAAIASTNEITSGNASTSICPSGWRLLTGGSGGEYSALDIAMGGTGSNQSTAEASNRWRAFPFNYVYSGGLIDYSTLSRGSYGLYWSSTVFIDIYYNGHSADTLVLSDSWLEPGTAGYDKYLGYTVRCVTY